MYEKITVVGNVGRDTEMRYLPSGQSVANFSMATNRSYKNKAGETVKVTKWFKVSAFGKLAETCNQYVKKGMVVLVEGNMNADEQGNPRVWTDNSGNPRASFEITANEVKFLSRAEPREAFQPSGNDYGGAPDGDIPF